MPFKKVSSKSVLVTREMATRHYGLPRLEVDEQRFKQWRYDEIAQEVRAGMFSSCVWATAYCPADRTTYGVNGQHTSKVFSEWEGTLPKVEVVVEHWNCPTLKDVRDLYATFDTRGSTRLAGEINRAYASIDPALLGVPKVVLDIACSALWFRHSPKTRPGRVTGRLRGESLVENRDFVLWLASISAGNFTEWHAKMKRGPVAAAMLVTWANEPESATAFWTAVRDACDPLPDSPSRTLERYLSRATVKEGVAMRKASTPREMFAKCLSAWNAYRAGVPKLSMLRYNPRHDLPVAV